MLMQPSDQVMIELPPRLRITDSLAVKMVPLLPSGRQCRPIRIGYLTDTVSCDEYNFVVLSARKTKA